MRCGEPEVATPYAYIKLADDTQLAYSEMRDDNTILVAVERPVDMGFDSGDCTLPAYRWSNVRGFSDEELA